MNSSTDSTQVLPVFPLMCFIGKDSGQHFKLHLGAFVSKLVRSQIVPESFLDFHDLDTFGD